MSGIISGNMVGGSAPLKTLILVDDNGNEVVGTVVDTLTVFDADPTMDIREGKKAVTDAGVVTGKKIIPAYHTTEGKRLVTAGSDFVIPLPIADRFDYTALQVVICAYNTSLSNSVAVDRVGIQDSMYTVQSTNILASITKDYENKTINLNITNNTNNKFVLRYFTYKEEY